MKLGMVLFRSPARTYNMVGDELVTVSPFKCIFIQPDDNRYIANNW